MDIYDDAGNPLSDAALIARIAALRLQIRTVAGGGISVVQGENRRIEYTEADSQFLQAELRDCLTVARQRGLPLGGNVGAIVVEYGHRG